MTPSDLKRIRAAAGLTQAALAERLPVSLRAVIKWESGERRISELTARAIAAIAQSRPPAMR